MARWSIIVSGKNIRKATVEKLVKTLETEFGEGASVSVSDAKLPETRADRFGAAISQIEDGKSELEGLRDELQEWYDNLPENFQNGEKGQQLQESITNLETAIDELENVIGTDVTFPAMMG
jgi:hypothetical protein